jgi:hypothetical protein
LYQINYNDLYSDELILLIDLRDEEINKLKNELNLLKESKTTFVMSPPNQNNIQLEKENEDLKLKVKELNADILQMRKFLKHK